MSTIHSNSAFRYNGYHTETNSFGVNINKKTVI